MHSLKDVAGRVAERDLFVHRLSIRFLCVFLAAIVRIALCPLFVLVERFGGCARQSLFTEGRVAPFVLKGD